MSALAVGAGGGFVPVSDGGPAGQELQTVGGRVNRHDEYADITDPVTPDVLNWLDAVLA